MLSKTAIDLPESFQPNDNQIIIGRGRLVKNHSGNLKFDSMVARVAREYSAAPCKAEKGVILTRLINEIHDAAPDAGFVRKDSFTGRWTLVEESLARQTAAQAIRNHLHQDYRSSKQFKQKRRIEQIKEMNDQQNKQNTIINRSFNSFNSFNSRIPTQLTNQSLVSMLQQKRVPRCVSPTGESSTNAVGPATAALAAATAATAPTQFEVNTNKTKDMFSILMSAFGTSINPTDNPYEPRPLAPMVNVDAFAPSPPSMAPTVSVDAFAPTPRPMAPTVSVDDFAPIPV